VAARALLAERDRPTAILAPDSVLALGVLLAVKELGLSLISFDDSDRADGVTPGLSVVPQPVHDLGQHAVSLIMARIRGFDGPPRHMKLAATFIERQSVAHPRGG
jgi:DNA-binding LacI/PurR family transcriptional regulator